jgi:hypothetical protein
MSNINASFQNVVNACSQARMTGPEHECIKKDLEFLATEINRLIEIEKQTEGLKKDLEDIKLKLKELEPGQE